MECKFVKEKVLLNGVETQILSGAVHYFRTLPEQWEDRLLKLKCCGFNTVETYLAWHLHEKREGQFDFSGMLDFPAFIRTAAGMELMVIVRPGPYICSECDLGGLPGWLLGIPGLRIRSSNPEFMKYTKRFFDHALPILAPLQCTRNGPILAMQVEGEHVRSIIPIPESQRIFTISWRNAPVSTATCSMAEQTSVLQAGQTSLMVNINLC